MRNVLDVLATLTVFALMLTIGVNQSLEQLMSLWRRRAALWRCLLAALVLVPAVFLVLLHVFSLPTEVATALALLAAAPGAPLTTKRSQLAGADLTFVTSLQLTLAVSAVMMTPLILAAFHATFELYTERVSMLQVAAQIAQVTLLPVAIGLLLKRLAPGLVARISGPLNATANLLFVALLGSVLVLLAVLPELRAQLAIGGPAVATIVLAASAALGIGHLLGGPRLDERAGLAVASVARNVGLALYLVALTADGQRMIPTIITFTLLGSVLAIAYSLIIKRRLSAGA